jgi:hypothetical protein
MRLSSWILFSLVAVAAFVIGATDANAEPMKVGIIGLDTSHVVAFTKVMNDPKAEGPLADVKVVAAYPGGSDDIPASRDRVEGFTKTLKEMGIEIVDSIDALLPKVDAVLLESVDGRPHLKQAIPVIKAGKPMFIDKPVAASLADAVAIFRLAKQYNVPVFSSSSLRFGDGVIKFRTEEPVGKILGCVTWSPCSYEEHHPDLYWYGVHGVEMLFTVMGTGCQSVSRTQSDAADVVTGLWEGGRTGTFRGLKQGVTGYGGVAFGTKKIEPIGGYGGYAPLVVEIAKFFKTKEPPVSAEETLELFAFMTAADVSKEKGGCAVSIESVMKEASLKADGLLSEIK